MISQSKSPARSGGARWRWTAAAALVAALPIVGTTDSWTSIERASTPGPISYKQTRFGGAFESLPMARLAWELDRRLPANIPIALDAKLQADPLWSQRLTEGLYPRRVQRNAEHVLGLADQAEGALVSGTIGHLALQPTPPAAHVVPPPRDDPHAMFSWWRTLFALLGVLGWGLIVMRRLMPATGPALLLGGAIVAGALINGLVATAATWFQTPLSRDPFLVMGLLLLLDSAYRVFKQRTDLPSIRAMLPGAAAIAAPTLLAAWLLWRLPITGWDGRSIWFFRAHQLAHHGFFALTDALNPGYQFSHASYPLLFPAWLSTFAVGGAFGERQAAAGIAVLFGATCAVWWGLFVPRLGRAATAALLLIVTAACLPLVERGYADPFVALWLPVVLVAAWQHKTMALAVVTAGALGLLKRESTIFCAATLAVAAWTAPALIDTGRKRFLIGATLVPAAAHALWTRVVDLPDPFLLTEPAEASVGERLFGFLRHSTSLVLHYPTVSVAILLALWAAITVRARGFEPARPLMLVGLLVWIISAGFFLITPFDLQWHLSAALPRLLITAAMAAIAGGLLQLSRRT